MARTRGTLTLRREDGRIVCESVRVADSTFRRMRGLLGRRNLPAGEGVALRPAWSIHTAFMQFSIDVVFLDQDQVVLRIDPNVRPFRAVSCRGAREVVELAAGECARRGLQAGDRVAWASRASSGVPLPANGAPADLREEPRASVLVASRDARFVKLSKFLLEGRGLELETAVQPGRLPEVVETSEASVIVLDAHDEVAPALRTANAARSLRPELPIVLVGEGAATHVPDGTTMYDKWNESDELMAAIEEALAARSRNPQDSGVGAA